MKDRAFIDTNLWIYLYSTDEEVKKNKVEDLLKGYDVSISIQVLNELSNVLLKKMKLSPIVVDRVIEEVSNASTVESLEIASIRKSLKLLSKYKYSFYDSLIITSALKSNCSILFSEDMQDGQMIENTLIIQNPFSSKITSSR